MATRIKRADAMKAAAGALPIIKTDDIATGDWRFVSNAYKVSNRMIPFKDATGKDRKLYSLQTEIEIMCDDNSWVKVPCSIQGQFSKEDTGAEFEGKAASAFEAIAGYPKDKTDRTKPDLTKEMRFVIRLV